MGDVSYARRLGLIVFAAGLTTLDLPSCAVADTAMLPVTIPATLLRRWNHDGEKKPSANELPERGSIPPG